MKYKVDVVIEKDVEGYFAFCPQLDGCFTQGDCYTEVVENIKDAVRLHIADRLDDGEDVLQGGGEMGVRIVEVVV